MTPKAALTAVDELDSLKVVELLWDESRAAMSPVRPFLLDPKTIQESMRLGGFSEEAVMVVQAVAEQIADDEALCRLLWHCYWSIFKAPKSPKLDGWPSFKKALGDQSSIFYLLVGLAMIPLTRRHHRELVIPEAVTKDTCQQVRCFCENHQRGEGGMGLEATQLAWLRHYTMKPYFRLGRMEYWLKPFKGGIVVYKHQDSGEILALAEEDIRFNGAGYVDGTGGQFDEENGWTSILEEGDEETVGNPVTPYGMALHKVVRLPWPEWERVLGPETPVLDMHIPPGGGLTPQACRDSHAQAVQFFDKHYPEQPFSALVCNSWMFNTQLEEILPENANLNRYMRELHLFPVKSTGEDGLWFIFLKRGITAENLDDCPRDTSLQRAILDFLKAGNTWRGGGMFMLREHVELFGRECYRSSWPPHILKENK